MVYKVLLDKRAFSDIDEALSYYNKVSPQLAKRFLVETKKAIKSLTKNPFFQIRYKDYRCLPIKIFPFMFHFVVDEKSKTVVVYALINTSKDSNKWL